MVLDSGAWMLAALTATVVGAGTMGVMRWRNARSAAPADLGRDTLTGLPGRSEFEDQLREAVHRADDRNQGLAVLCVGIDGFDLLNATYGREACDAVLRVTAQRIEAAREHGLPMARLGGTEFVLAVAGAVEQGRDVAARLVGELSAPLDVSGQIVRLSCSIGIATYPKHGAQAALVARASVAMRAAREGGGAAFAVFEARMEQDQREQSELARDLRDAVERNELMLYYQPKIDAQSLQITAAEALLRWQHPKRGIVSPAIFVPIAERHGLIGVIGDWVLREATRQAGEWRDRGLRMRVAINVSGLQMRQHDFTDRLARMLAQHRLRPERFTCEITETVAMEDTQVTHEAFNRLGKLGVHVSIDDFGTGHSSLALLRRLPAAELKIDRAFVTDLGRSGDALAVAKAVVQLAHSLDLRVVAEGVETEAQRDILVSLGCDELQGFLFAKPMPAQSLELWATDEADPANPGFRPSLFNDTVTPEFEG
ncbi:MAG: bifunctional diguanylate cyclase/phosphodiesterase [Rubrivivax sp.]|nr:bifunctional diguanylate cyclase/phosphodiesterase [Rubrivivax sp.]